jgi:hypothetical protein
MAGKRNIKKTEPEIDTSILLNKLKNIKKECKLLHSKSLKNELTKKEDNRYKAILNMFDNMKHPKTCDVNMVIKILKTVKPSSKEINLRLHLQQILFVLWMRENRIKDLENIRERLKKYGRK